MAPDTQTIDFNSTFLPLGLAPAPVPFFDNSTGVKTGVCPPSPGIRLCSAPNPEAATTPRWRIRAIRYTSIAAHAPASKRLRKC